jgi:Protein of unknown function (DUF2934)
MEPTNALMHVTDHPAIDQIAEPLRKAVRGAPEASTVPSTPGDAVHTPESRMNRIARRAHEIYEARGGEHGKALEDWLQAEREIDSEVARELGSEG